MEISLSSPATSIASDRFGHQIAISTKDNNISIFSAQNSSLMATIPIQTSTPNSLSFSSNEFGPQLAVGLSNGQIRVFSRVSSNSYKEIPQKIEFSHRGSVSCVSFHPSMCCVASGSLDGTFAVHSFVEGKWKTVAIPASLLGITAIDWSADSAEALSMQTLFVGGADGTIKIWRSSLGSDSWENIAKAQVHEGWVRRISSPSFVSGGTLKVGSVGDDFYAAVLKFNGKEVTLSKSSRLHCQATGVSWAMVDKTLVLSHIDGKTTMWKENENGTLTIVEE